MTNFQKYLFVFLITIGVLIGYSVLAVSKDDIVYPVAELGNCPDEAACFAYCEDSARLNECLDFAERHNLLSDRDIEKTRRFQSIGSVGPGGCTNELECETYCENVNNIQECLAFAERHGFMEEEELQEARKVAAALDQGAVLPGGCQSKAQCEAYCEDPNNMRECIAFAEQAGFMSPEELREAKQVLKALDAGVPLPGNCRGEEECEAYCEDPAHMEECVEFGIAAGFIPPEEAEEVRRILPLMKEGKMPGGCREREECEAYCALEENTEECTTFFVQAGFMTPEEAELFAKTGGKGPGGCSGERECETFCNNPANQQVCFEFATQHGLIPEDELRNIEQGLGQIREMLATVPREVAQCLREKLGLDVVQGIQEGTFLPGPEIGDSMEACFQLQQQIIENQMQECLSKSCDEFFACIESVGGGLGGGPGGPRGVPGEGGHGRGGGEGGLGGGFDGEIQAKIDSCIQEQFDQEGGDGFFPEEGEGFDQQEIERIIGEQQEQEIQRQIEQQARDQFQQQFNVPNDSGFSPDNIPDQGDILQQGIQQFEGLLPQAIEPDRNTGPSPEDIQRIEQQGIQEEEERRRQEEAERQRIEQQFQQQFQEQQQPSFPDEHPLQDDFQFQGSLLDAAARFLLQLLPR